MTLTRSLLALGALVATGCAPDYSHVELEPLSTPPVPVSVRGSRIEMPAGVAVVVKAELESDNATHFDESYQLDLLSAERYIFTTYRREEADQFVLVGVNPGETCLDVVVDGDREGCVPVLVTQPAL